MSLSYIWNPITPSTVVTTALVAVVFAAYLWHVFPRITGELLATIWIAGATFILICGAARWADGYPTWETYIGSAVLWTWYVGVATAAILIRRRL